jgi:LacI family transcriptional regulator
MKRPDPPTAIVFANDMMALGAYQAAAELSLRIPDDFSIVGMDDNFFVAYLAPPLTTVHVPTRELGRLGVQMLVDPDDKQRQVRSLVLPTALVVRHSTAPPPH